ncbi:hypothetical protein PENSPDRAFT_754340, partial [Peniophora sp. CONT]
MSGGSDLPVEVLCSIFRHMSFEYSPPFGDQGWLHSAAHVCRKWRGAAIGLSEFWAENICALRPDAATDAFLERARSAPLVFRARSHDRNMHFTKHQLALAEMHLVRIRHFEQPGPSSSSFIPLPASFVNALDRTIMSQLSILHLQRWDTAGDRSFMINFSLIAPVLLELYLDSVFFAVDAPLLRVLEVTNQDPRYRQSLTAAPTSEILGILKRTPLLEELKLEGMGAFEEVGESDTEVAASHVELPQLRKLRLEDDENNYGLYRLVHAAPSANIDIEEGMCDAGVELFATVFIAMERHLRAPTYDTLVVFEEQDDGGTHVNVRLRSSTGSLGEKLKGRDPEFKLDVFMAERTSSRDIIDALVPHINIDSIRFLDIGEISTDEYEHVEVDEVREIFVPFVNVSTVMLNIEAERRHVLALRREDTEEAKEDGSEDEDSDDEGEDGEERGGFPLPALRHLIIQDLTGELTRSVGELKEGWTVVLAILKERKRAGCPIRYLTLSEREKYASMDGDLAAIKEVDQGYIRRAESFVEKVFDSRGLNDDDRGDIVT